MALNSMIANQVLDSADSLGTEYAGAKPFRHVVIDDFFQPAFRDRLTAAFPPFDERLAMNENGEIGAKCTHEDLPRLGGPWADVDRMIQSPESMNCSTTRTTSVAARTRIGTGRIWTRTWISTSIRSPDGTGA